jgi:cell division protein FtsZ
MIPYSRDPHQVIPPSSVKIIGLGGAGANMLERIALDGMEGAELLALNTDVRTLGSCLAKEKLQLGVNLTKGLGAGGDPELGHQAVLEAEDAIRASVKGRRIVFLCVGLGGGTGSGAAPIVTRIAREEGAFVVVFATMPFAFEGKRRRDQAETSLNELAVLSNALVTFDNNRMGELVLAKQGIHEAFVAADHMISESIKAVIRLVIRPGLINVGLDDLMSALRTTRSRCLFGSGIANGKDRAAKALRNALASPLLDQGSLLKDAQTVLVHLSGGEDLTLFEIELLMQRLQKFVPEHAHVLFGAAVDPSMGDSLSLTLISALPEDSLAMAPRESLSRAAKDELDPSQGYTPPAASKPSPPEPPPLPDFSDIKDPEPEPEPTPPPSAKPELASPSSKLRKAIAAAAAEDIPSLFDDDRPFAEPETEKPAPASTHAPEPVEANLEDEDDDWTVDVPETPKATVAEFVSVAKEEPQPEEPATAPSFGASEPDPTPIEDDEDFDGPDLESSGFTPIPRRRPAGVAPWTSSKGTKNVTLGVSPAAPEPTAPEPEAPKLKLGIKTPGSPSELGLDSAPRGRFEGENPNVFEGEDLDLPPFLRKKK